MSISEWYSLERGDVIRDVESKTMRPVVETKDYLSTNTQNRIKIVYLEKLIKNSYPSEAIMLSVPDRNRFEKLGVRVQDRYIPKLNMKVGNDFQFPWYFKHIPC
jgi:hypothetical protein